MGKLQKQFESKYGFDAVNFVKQAGNEFFGSVKSLGVQSVLKIYAEKKGYDIEINDEFLSRLIEALAEAGEKFPENQKISIGQSENLIVPPLNPTVPKSKGVLADFKNIVGDDDLRPIMGGVFVSPDGFLVGTDAHKLVKYKNNEFKEYTDKVIDLKVYLGTKGDKIQFVEGKYPNYEAVIPKNNEHKVKDVPLYPFYNLCRSAIAIKKLTSAVVFNLQFKEKGVEFLLNPILLVELLEFALAKGFTKADIEFEAPNRAFLFKFEGESEGIIMPVTKSYQTSGILDSKPYTFDEVISEFSDGGKAKITKTKTLPKKSESKEPKKEVAYKKYEGSLNDVTYIPRRDISMVILKNGDELTNADIVDGVYRLKKKFAKGGEVKMKPIRYNWKIETEDDGFEEDEKQKIKILRKKIDFDEVRGHIITSQLEDNTNLRFYKEGNLVMTIQGDWNENIDELDSTIKIDDEYVKLNYHPLDGFGSVDLFTFKKLIDKAFKDLGIYSAIVSIEGYEEYAEEVEGFDKAKGLIQDIKGNTRFQVVKGKSEGLGKRVDSSRVIAEFEKGGAIAEKFILSFNYNPSNLSNKEAEKIVSKYTKNWKHDNDFDEVSFFVMDLKKSQADELKQELKMEDVYNIEIQKSRYAKGGTVKKGLKVAKKYTKLAYRKGK